MDGFSMAKLITEYHKGEDVYSDGAVEDEMLQWFKSGADLASILRADKRWPVLYHLARERRNLLEWFPFRKESHLLEIGAGCGALTGLFAEKAAKVTAVESSAMRTQIVFERNRSRENVEVIAGNICDLKFDVRFDYITLIGVLEYAAMFANENLRSAAAERRGYSDKNAADREAPARRLLECCASLLKPDGVLFVALENKFGLKYFAGAREDHTGRSFDGIEGYPEGGAAGTYSRAELEALLHKAGFADLKFYYPYPDYKLPDEIFSDDYPPEINHVFQNAPNYDRDRYRVFDEKKALANIIANKQFPFFANSFLVLASPGKA